MALEHSVEFCFIISHISVYGKLAKPPCDILTNRSLSKFFYVVAISVKLF